MYQKVALFKLNETDDVVYFPDEFSNVDLESMTEEEDPPSFKAARKKDKECLQRLEQNGALEHGM